MIQHAQYRFKYDRVIFSTQKILEHETKSNAHVFPSVGNNPAVLKNGTEKQLFIAFRQFPQITVCLLEFGSFVTIRSCNCFVRIVSTYVGNFKEK